MKISIQELARPSAASRDDARILQELFEETEDDVITIDTNGIPRIGIGFFDETLIMLNQVHSRTGKCITIIYEPPPPIPATFQNIVGYRKLKVEINEERLSVSTD